MSIVVVTGSSGHVGSEACRLFCEKGFDVIGIDNNMRGEFFDDAAGPDVMRHFLERNYHRKYTHYSLDIRDTGGISAIFKNYGREISLLIHAAAQTSEDWAEQDPVEDFSINAAGTVVALENLRRYAPEAVFIYASTCKVYGDASKDLPLLELDTRYELEKGHRWFDGIDESMPVDRASHGICAASKISADILVQEWGRRFGLKTACFRSGPVCGPAQAGLRHDGLFSEILRSILTGRKYGIRGFKGKQLQDVIHSSDLVNAFYLFYRRPESGAVYNVGGGRRTAISVLEAIDLCQEATGRRLCFDNAERHVFGEPPWWITGSGEFRGRYPEWKPVFDNELMVKELYGLLKNIVHSSLV